MSAGPWRALAQGTFLKVIAGAAVDDATEVFRFATVWALAGADAIDVCSDHHVVTAAVRGRAEAVRRFGESAGRTLVMASPTLPGDVHRLKAVLSRELCTNCKVCLPPVCPDDCIYPGAATVRVEQAKCRGCNSCIEICPHGALALVPMPTPPLADAVRIAIGAGADAVEVHLSGEPPDAVRRHLAAVWPALRPTTLLSVCIGSQQSSPAEVIAILRVIDEVRRDRPIVVQADGSTMGGRPGGLQALALAELVLELRLPQVYVIASGGVSELTWETATNHTLGIAGVGAGIRARELVRAALEDPLVFKDDGALRGVAEQARQLRRPAGSIGTIGGRSFRGPALARAGAIERRRAARQRGGTSTVPREEHHGQPH